MLSTLLLALAAGVLSGILGRVLYDRKRTQAALKSAEAQAARILELADRESEAKTKELLLEARAEILRERQEFDSAASRMRDELSDAGRRAQDEERLMQILRKELEDGGKDLEARRHDMTGRVQQLGRKEHELERLLQEERQRLEKISHLSLDEARRQLMKSIEHDTRRECSDMIKQLEDEAKELADRRAKQILSVAI
ncbi:MAG TPA: Rnase Y domain-containing protein, partial [bacterium]|nr:Rnase Y domain-containing protein [bacterium]